jgi:hypothetical protein
MTVKGWLWALAIFGLLAYLVVNNFMQDELKVPDCNKLRGAAADVCWDNLEREVRKTRSGVEHIMAAEFGTFFHGHSAHTGPQYRRMFEAVVSTDLGWWRRRQKIA